MKKIVTLVMVSLLGLSLVACSSKPKYDGKKMEAPGVLETISFDEMQKKKENGDRFMVIFTKDGCSWCAKLKEETLNPYLSDNGVKIYQVDLSLEPDGLQAGFLKLKEETGADSLEDVGTPTTIIYNKKKQEEVKSGVYTYDELDDYVQDYGLNVIDKK